MKLWRLAEPSDHRFARASRVGGTWQDGEYTERRRQLVIEWEPDSDLVGDFTWPGLNTDIVITDRVGCSLKDGGVAGFELRTLHMKESAQAARGRSRKPKVKLPYSGPKLWDLWVTAWAQIDRDRSSVEQVQRSDGSTSWKVVGVQWEERAWDPGRGEMVKTMHPRCEGMGIFVPPIRGILRVEEVPAWVLCTDDVKRLIEDYGYTNVTFMEVGDAL